MSNKDKLYETFGELLYVIAMADGVIQNEEVETLEKVLASHPWAADIKWSFDYERKKNSDIEDVYAKVIDFCKYYGPDPEYQNMLDVMETIAAASDGIEASEEQKMNNFTRTLTEKFRTDIEKLYE